MVSTAVGIVATFAAPWLELRGTYAAWRIVEWHAFWRGAESFQLASVVAANYRVPIEFATTDLPAMLANLFVLGSALGAWHGIAFIGLLVIGARIRLRAGTSRARVAVELVSIVVVNATVVYLLAILLALPSSLASKVDFRPGADVHTDSLIWSSVTVLPVAPAFALITAVAGITTLAMRAKSKIQNIKSF